jgi:hypothetical protein
MMADRSLRSEGPRTGTTAFGQFAQYNFEAFVLHATLTASAHASSKGAPGAASGYAQDAFHFDFGIISLHRTKWP